MFTFVMKEALQRSRRAEDWQGKLLAHDLDGEINCLYSSQDVWHEVTALKSRRIAQVGHLVVGGAIYVVEYWAGQPSLGQTPKIMKVVTIAQTHSRDRTPTDSSVVKSQSAQTSDCLVVETRPNPRYQPYLNLMRWTAPITGTAMSQIG
jgi:hypothetical protein